MALLSYVLIHCTAKPFYELPLNQSFLPCICVGEQLWYHLLVPKGCFSRITWPRAWVPRWVVTMSRGYHSGGNLCLALCTTSTSQPGLQAQALVRPAICFSDKNYGKNHFLLFAYEKWAINRYIHFVLHVCSYLLNMRLLLQERVKILFNSCKFFLWDKEMKISARILRKNENFCKDFSDFLNDKN